jgi:phosphoribosylformylglycinamidine (FGAM) synthase PurS component
MNASRESNLPGKTWRIFVQYDPRQADHEGAHLLAAWRAAGLAPVKKIRTGQAYELSGDLGPADVKTLVDKLLVDPIVQVAEVHEGGVPPFEGARRAQIWPRPGVSDPVAATVKEAARDLSVQGLSDVKSGRVFDFFGAPAESDVRQFSENYLMNPLVQKVEVS